MLDRLTEKLLQQVFAPLVKTGTARSHHPFRQGADLRRRRPAPGAPALCRQTRRPWRCCATLTLNFGELFMQQRLLVEQGTVYDVLELVLRGAKQVPVSATVRMLDAWRMKLRPLLQNNLRGKSRANVAHHYDLDDRLYQPLTASASTPAPISSRATKT